MLHISLNLLWDYCNVSVQVDLGFNMNILDIGSGFTGSEFQLRQVCLQLVLGLFAFTFLKIMLSLNLFAYERDIVNKPSAVCHCFILLSMYDMVIHTVPGWNVSIFNILIKSKT